MKKSTKVALLTIPVIGALSLGGLFLAQPASADAENDSNFLSRMSDILQIDEDSISEALYQIKIENVEERLAEGDIDEETADDMIKRIESGETPLFEMSQRRGEGMMREMHAKMQQETEEIANFLNITKESLHEEREDGATLLEIAIANGKSQEELVTYLTNSAEERINSALENGEIDQERADEMLENMIDRIDERINETAIRGQRGNIENS